MLKKIRVLIIDDSAFMRKSLGIMLESDPEIEVIGFGKDGLEGFNKAKELRPDIITLDVEMPVMDGLTCLQKIMAECSTPVLMVSSITTEGADATLKALEYGAVDFISKELSFISVNIIHIKEDLIRKVKEIVKQKTVHERLIRIQKLGGTKIPEKKTKSTITKLLPKLNYNAVAIGISTGGPLSLQKVIPLLEKKNIPIFIVQHMPPKFTKSLAERLNGMSKYAVKEAEPDEPVSGGVVYLAPGGYHMTLKRGQGNNPYIHIDEKPTTTLHRPSVDVMMSSVVKYYGKNTLGVIMTGMGRDGTEGIKELKSVGGFCLAQDEDSCVVYGMPKSVVDLGMADVIAPLEKIPEILNESI